jgi:hypothetical protein
MAEEGSEIMNECIGVFHKSLITCLNEGFQKEGGVHYEEITQPSWPPTY